ncbi:hypothetical protein L210DRAFT_850314 [Boletus edulis BED1]|uniref:Uncharacterized protein n=1 Tax=Boletus edulis BED1 TaxID=1328754 RepID=A0AAD4BU18_BOLED|nr:hypothetical protein L210DRAFT_850314 [Boletus edulis BED1]
MASLDDEERTSTYDTVYDSLLTMPKHLVLAQATYEVHFTRHIVANNVWDYHPPRGSESFETILVGEIRPELCGTRFSAKGNHYMGSVFNPTLIEDKTRVKNVLVLGKPSDAPACFGDLFDNQIATLCDVVGQDKRELSGKNIQIKEWTAHADAGNTGSPDYIVVVTEPMYTTVRSAQSSKHSKGRITKKVLTERAVAAVAASSSSKTVEDFDFEDMDLASTLTVTTNDLYNPSVLPDYGGDLFKHVHAKLRQLDFRDVNDELIPPQDWYSQLRQGTLVMVRTSLHAFNWDNRRVSTTTIPPPHQCIISFQVYQLNAHTVRVLLPSLSDIEERKPTILDPDSFKKRTTSEAAALVSQVVLGKRSRK